MLMIRFCNHSLYNYIIDETLMQLINFGIDLKKYFRSNLSFFEITWETYLICIITYLFDKAFQRAWYFSYEKRL
jgi:hypothetical protein